MFLLVSAGTGAYISSQPKDPQSEDAYSHCIHFPAIKTTPAPARKGAQVAICSGVAVTLIDQVHASITGVYSGKCGTEMTWVFQTANKGTGPYVVDLDKSSLRMYDSTGKSYPLSRQCGGIPHSGSLAEPMTIAPGDIHKGYVVFNAHGISASSAYLDFHFVLSGSRVAFRYVLP
jgi:hypothetical protein